MHQTSLAILGSWARNAKEKSNLRELNYTTPEGSRRTSCPPTRLQQRKKKESQNVDKSILWYDARSENLSSTSWRSSSKNLPGWRFGQFLIQVPLKATIHNPKQSVVVREYLLPEEDNIGMVLDKVHGRYHWICKVDTIKKYNGKPKVLICQNLYRMHQLLLEAMNKTLW